MTKTHGFQEGPKLLFRGGPDLPFPRGETTVLGLKDKACEFTSYFRVDLKLTTIEGVHSRRWIIETVQLNVSF